MTQWQCSNDIVERQLDRKMKRGGGRKRIGSDGRWRGNRNAREGLLYRYSMRSSSPRRKAKHQLKEWLKVLRHSVSIWILKSTWRMYVVCILLWELRIPGDKPMTDKDQTIKWQRNESHNSLVPLLITRVTTQASRLCQNSKYVECQHGDLSISYTCRQISPNLSILETPQSLKLQSRNPEPLVWFHSDS